MLAVGIDWATRSHTVALMSKPGEVIATFTIKNSLDGYFLLLDRIRYYAAGQPLAAGAAAILVGRPRRLAAADALQQRLRLRPVAAGRLACIGELVKDQVEKRQDHEDGNDPGSPGNPGGARFPAGQHGASIQDGDRLPALEGELAGAVRGVVEVDGERPLHLRGWALAVSFGRRPKLTLTPPPASRS